MSFYLRFFLKIYLKENIYMKKITLILIILTILTSCANKKQVTKSSIETNTTEQIDSISNTTKQVEDSIEITIEEQIEETTTDTTNNQTTKRIINRRTNIKKVGNTTTKQIEETHKDIKEKKKEENKSKNIKQYPIRKYLSIISIIILFVLIYRFISNRRQ